MSAEMVLELAYIHYIGRVETNDSRNNMNLHCFKIWIESGIFLARIYLHILPKTTQDVRVARTSLIKHWFFWLRFEQRFVSFKNSIGGIILDF